MKQYIVKYALTKDRTGCRMINARDEEEAKMKCRDLVKNRRGFLYVYSAMSLD